MQGNLLNVSVALMSRRAVYAPGDKPRHGSGSRGTTPGGAAPALPCAPDHCRGRRAPSRPPPLLATLERTHDALAQAFAQVGDGRLW